MVAKHDPRARMASAICFAALSADRFDLVAFQLPLTTRKAIEKVSAI